MQDAVAPLAPSTPLAASTAMNAQWHWTTHIRLPSIGFNRLSVRKTCYPPLTFPTHLKAYTDASFVQLRAVISMDKKQIAFYSPKLKEMQMRSTTTERELLAIVDTIKQFLNILIGQQNTISTAQKKLMREQLYIDRVIRWRLIIKEFGPKLISTKSEHDSMPDTLSRLATATLSTTNTFAMLRQRNSHFFRLTKSEQKNLMSRKTPKKNSTVEQVLSTVLSPHSDHSQQADPIQ